MIPITGTFFDILFLLSGIVIYITILSTWQAHKNELWIIARENRRKERLHFNWLMEIGLEEAAYYFNDEGLDTVGRWKMYGRNRK